MADEPSKRKVLFEDPSDGDDAFAAVNRGEARVGEVLGHLRAARGIEIADISAHLRIRDQYLAAIERGDLAQLPGPTYAMGFVRSYANFLGLDGEEAVRLFKGEREGEAQKATLNFPEPVSESRIPRGAVLFISAVLAILAYGGWYYLSSRDMQIVDLVPQVPKAMDGGAGGEAAKPAAPAVTTEAPKATAAATVAPDTAAPAATTGTPAATTSAPVPAPTAQPAATPVTAAPAAPPESGATPRASTPAAPEPTPSTPASPAVSVPSTPAASAPATPPAPSPAPVASAPTPSPAQPAPIQTAAAPPSAAAVSTPPSPAASAPQTAAVASAPAAPPSGPLGAAIELKAKGDSWVQIRGPGGRVVVMRIFRTGDTFKVPDEKGLTLMTGNAGAIEITVDGKTVPSIGPFGAVRRDVALDPERLKSGTAAGR